MGNKSVFIPKAKIDETLSQEAVEGKHLLDPLKGISLDGGVPIHILEDHKVSNEAEVHRHESDLWICLEGEVDFIVGGEMVDPWAKKLPDGGIDDREIKANEIKDGTSYTVKAGDILWIPAGEPHVHNAEGTARLYIIKVPVREDFPLEDVAGWKGE